MKRKLDENDVPAAAEDTEMETTADPQPETKEAQNPPAEEAVKAFTDFGLDFRLLQAIAQQKFEKPTLVQQKAIPLALKGQDLLVKAKTGSGKTAAYVLPVLHAILKRKQTDKSFFTSALILVPTRELADQVYKNINQFASFCGGEITSINITNKVSDNVLQSLLANMPDIVISTPGRAWHAANSSFLSLDKLSHLVLDEADLVLSFGFNKDLESIAATIPKHLQTILMSATLTTEVETLKGMLCRNPTLLDLVEKDAAGEGVTQYVVTCGEDEKFLLTYVIFKLKLVTGKCLIFVADVDRCYRLKLFFEQFGIRSCILNSELPVNSRINCIEEFNRNLYDIIIASDENELLGNEGQEKDGDEEEEEEEAQANGDVSKEEQKKKKRKASKKKRDREFGVARGVDFKNVRAVINFDLPTTAKSYTHRIGRTARAGQTGMALSFVVPASLYRKHMPTTVETAAKDEKIMARIVRQQAKVGKEVEPYHFDMKQVEAFRYRMNDALRSVTKVAVREARMREIRQELLKSEKLKQHFEENPAEFQHLARHDTELRTVRTQSHLKHVPEYLLPKDGKNALSPSEVGFVPLRKRDDKKRMDRRKAKYFARGGNRGPGRTSSNPLKTFRGGKKR